MDIYQLTVEVAGRDVTLQVKAGVMASMEMGAWDGKNQTPKSKVNAIVGETDQGPQAWVQVAAFAETNSLQVTHQGWISQNQLMLEPVAKLAPVKASLVRVEAPTEEMNKCQIDAVFGIMSCCTSNGSGCYVTCCGACCADPYGCPGASCCP